MRGKMTPVEAMILGLALAIAAVMATMLSGCGRTPDEPGVPSGEDFAPEAEDFTCLHGQVQVGRLRVMNVLGHQDEAERVAASDTGGVYPVGTFLQMVPQEAMVKRGAGFSPQTNDWEFFQLSIGEAGAEIVDRGPFARGGAGECFACHADAEEKWDLTCAPGEACGYNEAAHGLFDWLVQSDARCAQP